MKTIKLGLLCTLVFSFLMTSCREEEEDNNQDLAVQFKVIATENVDVKSTVVQIGADQTIDYNVDGQTWTSESQVINTSSKYLRIASTANAYDGDSELIVQILVDGEIAAADTVTTSAGTMNLIAKKSLNFHEL